MEYRRLGRTGLKVSELCLGTMQFGWSADEQLSHQILDAAWDAGINFIDTADVYSRWVAGNPGGISEEIIGRWLQSRKIHRHELILATKVRSKMGEGPNDQGLSRYHILHAVEESLRRLQTDVIDLYQSHSLDAETPIEETLYAFDSLVQSGKVRYIGASNYPAWRLVESLWASDSNHLVRYDSLQPHYSLVHRAEFERELKPVCETYGVGVIPYSPLAGGFLTGKYRRDGEKPETFRNVQKYFNEKNYALIDQLEEIGRAQGKTISQVALAWLLSQPVITSPIIGPRTLDQFQDNIGAAGYRLTPDVMAALDEASRWN